jgi:hypothetical protein
MGNISIWIFKKSFGKAWIYLAQDMDEWRVVVKAEISIRFAKIVGNFLTSIFKTESAHGIRYFFIPQSIAICPRTFSNQVDRQYQ